MPDNDFTKNIIVNTRIMLTNKTVYRVTHINNFTIPGIRNLTVIQTVLRDDDDLINNSGIECLNDIGLDFNSDQVISRLDESMKYLESKFCKEQTKWL